MPRTKGGSKVPNVKLRPAKSQKKPTKRGLLRPGSSAPDEPGSSPFGQRALLEGSKPLRGAHISSTRILEKKDSFTKAKRMGAEASSSLMTFSTHLLALEPDYDNEKYKAAWEAGMHIVKPSWINEIYERWRLDETVDVMKSMEPHYIGPFTGLCLSLTGPTDPVVRESFHRAVLQGGGVSMKSLDLGCTHLVCSTGESEKIRWVQRLDPKPRDSNRQPPIMVWEEWLWDSFAAGRRLDESQYLLSKPRPTRKYSDVVKQLWPLKEIGTQVPTALMQAPLTVPIPVAQLTDELEMPVIAKRVRNAGRKEWDRIIQRRTLPGLSQDAAANYVNNPYTPPKKASRQAATPLRRRGSLSSSTVNATPGWHKRSPPKQKQVFLAAESAPPTNGLSFPDSSSPQRVSAMRLPAENEAVALAKPKVVTCKRTENPRPPTFLGRIDRTNAFAKHGPVPTPKHQVQKNGGPDGLTSAIFAGKRVRTIGEASCAALRQEIERAGAALIDRTGAEVDFYVVRLAGGAELMKKEVSAEDHHKVRTECWVERCLFESKICEVDENVTFRPLGVPTPLADASQLFVASSGLDLSEQTWVKRLLRVLGMNWSQAFSKKCTHLICPSKQGPKYDKAREWEILIVDLGWLRDIAISGRILPLHPASFADKTIAFTDRSSQSQVLSISSVDSGSRKSVSMDVQPSQGTRLFAPGLPSSSACNPPIKSAAIFGDPAAFLLPVFGASSPTKEGPQRTQSPASPSPRRNLTTANAALPLSKDRVPSSVSPEALTFPQLQREGLDPKKMKGLAGDIGALLLGSKRRAEDDSNEGDMLASTGSVSGSGSRKRPRRPISRAKTVSDATSTPPRMQPQVFFASTDDTEDSQTPFDDTTAGGVSCGVHYDDPSSRAEKKRLMSLLNGEDESQVASESIPAQPAATSVKKAASKKTTTSRRKTRTSGF